MRRRGSERTDGRELDGAAGGEDVERGGHWITGKIETAIDAMSECVSCERVRVVTAVVFLLNSSCGVWRVKFESWWREVPCFGGFWESGDCWMVRTRLWIASSSNVVRCFYFWIWLRICGNC